MVRTVVVLLLVLAVDAELVSVRSATELNVARRTTKQHATPPQQLEELTGAKPTNGAKTTRKLETDANKENVEATVRKEPVKPDEDSESDDDDRAGPINIFVRRVRLAVEKNEKKFRFGWALSVGLYILAVWGITACVFAALGARYGTVGIGFQENTMYYMELWFSYIGIGSGIALRLIPFFYDSLLKNRIFLHHVPDSDISIPSAIEAINKGGFDWRTFLDGEMKRYYGVAPPDLKMEEYKPQSFEEWMCPAGSKENYDLTKILIQFFHPKTTYVSKARGTSLLRANNPPEREEALKAAYEYKRAAYEADLFQILMGKALAGAEADKDSATDKEKSPTVVKEKRVVQSLSSLGQRSPDKEVVKKAAMSEKALSVTKTPVSMMWQGKPLLKSQFKETKSNLDITVQKARDALKATIKACWKRKNRKEDKLGKEKKDRFSDMMASGSGWSGFFVSVALLVPMLRNFIGVHRLKCKPWVNDDTGSFRQNMVFYDYNNGENTYPTIHHVKHWNWDLHLVCDDGFTPVNSAISCSMIGVRVVYWSHLITYWPWRTLGCCVKNSAASTLTNFYVTPGPGGNVTAKWTEDEHFISSCGTYQTVFIHACAVPSTVEDSAKSAYCAYECDHGTDRCVKVESSIFDATRAKWEEYDALYPETADQKATQSYLDNSFVKFDADSEIVSLAPPTGGSVVYRLVTVNELSGSVSGNFQDAVANAPVVVHTQKVRQLRS